MKSYMIWLKGGETINGTMDADSAEALRRRIGDKSAVFLFNDGDGDLVAVDIEQIAAFSYRDEDATKAPRVGFGVNGNDQE